MPKPGTSLQITIVGSGAANCVGRAARRVESLTQIWGLLTHGILLDSGYWTQGTGLRVLDSGYVL
jgi:hypothetical protein